MTTLKKLLTVLALLTCGAFVSCEKNEDEADLFSNASKEYIYPKEAVIYGLQGPPVGMAELSRETYTYDEMGRITNVKGTTGGNEIEYRNYVYGDKKCEFDFFMNGKWHSHNINMYGDDNFKHIASHVTYHVIGGEVTETIGTRTEYEYNSRWDTTRESSYFGGTILYNDILREYTYQHKTRSVKSTQKIAPNYDGNFIRTSSASTATYHDQGLKYIMESNSHRDDDPDNSSRTVYTWDQDKWLPLKSETYNNSGKLTGKTEYEYDGKKVTESVSRIVADINPDELTISQVTETIYY